MSRELRPLLLFEYQATFPSHTCSPPTFNININIEHSHKQHHHLAVAKKLFPSHNPFPSLRLLNMAGKSDNAENGATPTTPKAAASGGGYESLSTREQEILAKAMTCLKVAPEIDFPMLASAVGMTNPRSAVNAWAQIKKKMGWTMATPDSPAVAKTPASAKGKRKVAVVKDEAGDDEDATATAKRAKATPKARKKAAATPKKGKGAASPKSSDVADPESEEDKADVKDETPDGEA